MNNHSESEGKIPPAAGHDVKASAADEKQGPLENTSNGDTDKVKNISGKANEAGQKSK